MKLRARLQRGLTMIEVLITLVIVAFGLLGVGALQMMSLQVNQGANQRTQAAILANSVLDCIRGNRPNALRYARTFGASAPDPASADVPTADMGAIVRQLQTVLPGGDLQVVVTQANTANNKAFFAVQVTVSWSEGGRQLDRQETGPIQPTTFELRTNV